MNQGFIELKNVFKENDINIFLNELGIFLQKENIYYKILNKQDYNEEKYYVNNTWSLINNYNKLYYYPKPVVNVRNNKDYNVDSGLIDIYNIDKLLTITDKIFNKSLIQTILEKILNKKVCIKMIKLQILKNNYNPCKLHKDDNTIKFGIFLSDVFENNEGVNVFIKNSHKENNKEISKEDIHLFFGNKGDCFIYYQNGLHGKTIQNHEDNKMHIYLIYDFEIIC